MTEPPSTMEILVTRATVALLVGLAVAEVVWYGLSTDELQRIWRNISARPDGPRTFHFVLQPAMATVAALHDGTEDARLDRTPYLAAILLGREGKGARLWEGVLSTGRILILGVVMDVAYQLAFLVSFSPGESAIIAILLAFLPYALLRGPLERAARIHIVRRSARRASGPGSKQ